MEKGIKCISSSFTNWMAFQYPSVLNKLLRDHTTNKNIVWATNIYDAFGAEFSQNSYITEYSLKRLQDGYLQPRILKSLIVQKERTKKHAEVFTPAWICNQMNNVCDEEWFGKKDVFNKETNDNSWVVTTSPISFPDTKKKQWTNYVDSKRLEITCGEAPYIVSRYDAATGDYIELNQRIGILDRKLRVVNENTTSKEDWIKWCIRAFQSVYGYEYQGDNLLIARMNLLQTFVEYYEDRWGECPCIAILSKIANIISWNIWQMDGLTYKVPFIPVDVNSYQITLFEELENEDCSNLQEVNDYCKIFDWRSKMSVQFVSLKKEGK